MYFKIKSEYAGLEIKFNDSTMVKIEKSIFPQRGCVFIVRKDLGSYVHTWNNDERYAKIANRYFERFKDV